jgi:hypothetical protein
MFQGRIRKLSTFSFVASFAATATALALGCQSSHAEIHPSLCYIPGAGGGRVIRRRGFENEFKARNVPMKVFDVGHAQTAQELAQVFVQIFNEQLAKDPDFRCHIIGYSMGGIVMRYAVNHLTVQDPELGEVPLKDRVLSMTSASTPHRGTPAAEVIARYMGDLDPGMMQMGETQIGVFNDPNDTANYSPIVEGIPAYSYQSYLDSASEAQGFPERLGYQAICQDYAHRPDHPDCTNDGIVPTASQAWGRVLGRFHVPHGFFGGDLGFSPDAVDVYEAHWHFLANDLPAFLERDSPLRIEILKSAGSALSNKDSTLDVHPLRTGVQTGGAF